MLVRLAMIRAEVNGGVTVKMILSIQRAVNTPVGLCFVERIERMIKAFKRTPEYSPKPALSCYPCPTLGVGRRDRDMEVECSLSSC